MDWDDVRITNVEVSPSSNLGIVNKLSTFWAMREFDVRFGLDWCKNKSEPVCIRAKTLDHEDFIYNIDYVRYCIFDVVDAFYSYFC